MKKAIKIISFLMSIFMIIALLGACSSNKTDTKSTTTTTTTTRNLSIVAPEKPEFVDPGSNGSRNNKPLGFQFDKPAVGEDIVVLTTSMGKIRLRLFADEAPIAVANFLALVKGGYYDKLIFHRVNEFMIQGGDPLGNGSGGESVWKDSFVLETNENLLHFRGALAMAHSSTGQSNGSQFYIVQKPKVTDADVKDKGFSTEVINMYRAKGGEPFLDTSYTVFGQAFADDLKVVDTIAALRVKDTEKPSKTITIESAKIEKYDGK